MIYNKLSSFMDTKGLNFSELAKKTGISRQALTSLANNQSTGIQFATLDKLLTTLDVPVEKLIIFVGEPPENFEVSAKLLDSSDYAINHEQIEIDTNSIEMATHFEVNYSLTVNIGKESKLKIDTKLSAHAKYAFSGNMPKNNIIHQWEYTADDEFKTLIDSPIFSNEERYEITKLLNNFLLDCGKNVYENEYDELIITDSLYL